MKRRTVHKITPSRPSTFDQQFWPVLVALTVLSGISLGAVLTTMSGPWMWATLLLMPLMAALAIFLLFNLDNNRLRRSLQFAIISSLALHLLVLIFASVINIFQNPFKPNERQVAQRPNRTIEISDQRAAFVWEETNARTVPEPIVETQRQTTPTTNVQPQPTPVVETKPQIDPQLVRRENATPSVPRQNRELSKLRRQKNNLQPQSSQRATGVEMAANNPQPAADAAAESANQADSVARPANAPNETVAESAKASPAPESTQPTRVAQATSNPRNLRPADTPTQSSPRPTSSNARVRRPTPRLPIASKTAPVKENVEVASTTQPTVNQPSNSASAVTRRPVESRTDRPAFTNRPQPQLSTRAQVARTVERRQNTPAPPSISNPTSVTITPRRSTTESAIVSSTVPVEQPARSPESKTASRTLQSKTLSVMRSSEGISGVGRASNLSRFTGGVNSPASRASDSARRERTQSTPTDAPMLTSSSKSQTRRSVGATRIPSSAFKAESTSAAKISGAKTPGERTLESSATLVDAASTNHRDEVSAEKGSANVDLGATKIVNDRQSQRRSGGGQPEVARLNPDSTRRSRDRSSQQPSLVASANAEVAAPRNQSAAPPSANALEAAAESAFAARTGGENPTTLERWAAQEVGELADQGQSNLAQQLADDRERGRQNTLDSGWQDEEEEDDDDSNQAGTQRTRIAQAPVTRSDPGFGIADSDASAVAQSTENGEAINESNAAAVDRQALAALTGSGVGRMVTDSLLKTAATEPVLEPATNRRSGSANSNLAETGITTGIANAATSRGTRSTKSALVPKLDGSATISAVKTVNPGSRNQRELDSAIVSIDRTEPSALEQIQGMELDIDALDGPAGLGDRADLYVGVMTRPSSRDSEQLQPDMTNRFRSKRFGGVPAVNPDAVIAKEAFRNRSPSAMAKASEPTTEAAIHLGLEFLARHQSTDGSWSLTGFDRDEPQQMTQLESDTAATGLALLAFQGAGYNHREFKYARQVNHAIQWLIENQAEDGGLYVPSDKKSDNACRLYSHGIAALALTEAYGMTQDARLKEPAQKALDYIVDSQDARKGGWRYFDQPGKKSSDTSVSGWMMMALQSGRLAGLEIEDATFESIDGWLDVAADPDNESLYRYNPYAKDSKGVSRMQGRRPTPSMTSVGLLMRVYAGWDKDDPRLLAGTDYLLDTQMPSDSTPQLRDTYYWYYATQVIKHVDGRRWERWNDQLRPLLTRSQEKSGELAGSWHPYKPVPDRWGAFGGRIYVTTMNLLSLEVRHRLLPLYRQGEELDEVQPPILADSQTDSTETVSTTESMNITAEVDRPRIPTANQNPTLPTESNNTAVRRPPNNSATSTIVRKLVFPDSDVIPDAAIVGELAINTSVTAELNKPDSPAAPVPGPESGQRTINSAPRTRSTIKPITTVADFSPGTDDRDSTATMVDSKSDLTVSKPDLDNLEDSALNKLNFDLRPALMPGEEAGANSIQRAKSKLTEAGVSATVRDPAKRSRNLKPKIEIEPKVAEPVQPQPEVLFASVSGLVKLDGEILKNAEVKLIPIDLDAETITARTDKTGRFQMTAEGSDRRPGVRVGRYKVAITTYVESPDEDVIDLLERVPAKYNSKTKLQVTIGVDKKNSFKINLSSK